MGNSKKSPGWYVDPKNSKQWRYWDGGRWTNHYEPRDPQFPDLAPIRLPSLSQDRDPPPKPAFSHLTTPTTESPKPKTTKEPNPKTSSHSTASSSANTDFATTRPANTPTTTVDPTSDRALRSSASAWQPGWYADPQDNRQWRYWDGTEWTESRSPRRRETRHETLPGNASQPPYSPNPALILFVLGAVGAVILLVVTDSLHLLGALLAFIFALL
ncbi:MAG: DUF2510 domain-containing protein [Acidimicrobiaceae bacterium]|nr:DUF2510 domain-containing protein [Acidimicrobiaceae bacterium]